MFKTIDRIMTGRGETGSWKRAGRRLRTSALLGIGACAFAAEERPNILFIMADDHTLQSWGVYDSILQPYVQAPHIQRLSREGILLNRAYSTNALCGPSRASILTGQYSHLNGVYSNEDGLDPAKENVATLLREAGYETALMGKWHLHNKPSGFDHYNILIGQGEYHNPVLRNAANWDAGGKAVEGFSTDVITTESLNWLKERSDKEPFFLMCQFKASHEPFGYPERNRHLYEDISFPYPPTFNETWPDSTTRTFQGQTLDILAERMHRQPARYQLDAFPVEGRTPNQLREAAYQELVRNFLRSTQAIDENIGRLVAYLEESGQLDDTLVVYTSDQGYFLGEHGMFDKRVMYEESIRMPCVIRYPKEIPAGSANEDFILNVDFAPFFLDYAGVPTPGSMQGRSFRRNLQGRSYTDWRSSIYYRYWTHQSNRPGHYGIRNDRYKLIFFHGMPREASGTQTAPTPPTWEFYDLQEDPLESENQYSNRKYKRVIGNLKIELQGLREELGDTDPGRLD